MGLAKAPRLSVVVLPFHNIGGEGMDEATVDAITEDLTSDLARGYGLFVIGRSSAFTYKGKHIDIKRVGEELGLRYVVEGSVRKADGKLRVLHRWTLKLPKPATTTTTLKRYFPKIKGLKPGRYILICTVLEQEGRHFDLGMIYRFTIE